MSRFTIKQWRNIKGYTQKQFADMIGMNFLTYHAKEAGKRPWKADELRTIAKVLNVSIDNEIEY